MASSSSESLQLAPIDPTSAVTIDPTKLAEVPAIKEAIDAAEASKLEHTKQMVERARAIPCTLSTINIITFSEQLTNEQLDKITEWSYEIEKQVKDTQILDIYLNKETRVHEISFKSPYQQNFFMALNFKFISHFESDNIISTLGVRSCVQVSTIALREWVERDRIIRGKVALMVEQHKKDGLTQEESREILVEEVMKIAHYNPDTAKKEFEDLLAKIKEQQESKQSDETEDVKTTED